MQAYRELKPMVLWSTTFRPNTDYDTFGSTLEAFSAQNNELITGFLTRKGNNVLTYTRTRYPRRKYGIPSRPHLVESTFALADQFGAYPSLDHEGGRVVRAVIGLREGYDETGKEHDIREVERNLGSVALTIRSGEIFTMHPPTSGQEAPSLYSEPCAVVTISANRGLPGEPHIERIYNCARRLGQERLAIEDFTLWQAYLVETPCCTSPDTE